MTSASYLLEAASLIDACLSLFNRWVKLMFSKIFITNIILVLVATAGGLTCIVNTNVKNARQ